MSACLNKEKILLLDVHGDLDPQERAAWEKHLQACAGCLEEKKRTLQLLENIKQTIEIPVFDSKADDMLIKTLMNKLHTRKTTNKKRIKWPSIWLRPFPALAGACIIILVIGTYSLKTLHTTSENHYQADSNLADMISSEELEIITNLDMLNDMDSIRKIVELVDYSESNKSLNNSIPNIQGVTRHDGETYV